MTFADDVIARAARAIAPHFAAHDIRWASFGGRGVMTVPGEAEIALALKEMVDQVTPGGRLDSRHLVVEWLLEEVDEGTPMPGEIRILFHLADIEPQEEP